VVGVRSRHGSLPDGSAARRQGGLYRPPSGWRLRRRAFDGAGSYPEAEAVDGSAAAVTLSTTHRYDQPGIYFPTALVGSHREGDVDASSRRIPNLASARVVVA
jgi:hypothetical protein